MIAIINYEAGNLASVSNAMQRLDAPFIITAKRDELEAADAIILPGVGHAKPAMQALEKNGLVAWLQQTKKPLLGICLGMQLLFEHSAEGGGTDGLGLIPGSLKKFSSDTKKVPHMGWNTCSARQNHPLLNDVAPSDYFYFVHSFYAPLNKYTLASCSYEEPFAAIAARDNVMGAQFHPEKSGKAGQKILSNFIALAQL